MSILNNTGIRAGASGAAGGGYEIEKSCRFEDGDSANLSRVPSSSGDRQKWTLSFWFKQVSEAATHFFSTYGSANDDGSYFRVWKNSDGTMNVSFWNYYGFVSSEQFRDPSAWYHCVIAMDTTLSTAADRCKMWMNGVELSHPGTSATQNANYGWNHNHQSMIGNMTTQAGATSGGGDSYMAEVYNIDGQALTASDFGEFNSTTGVWDPKEYTGTYTLASHNDGTTWSSSLTSNGTLQNAGQAFDGIVTNRAQTQGFGSNKTITFAPSSAINFSSKLEVYCEQGSATPTATWNGNVVNPGGSAWVTVYSGSGALSSTYPLVIDTESANEYATLNGVRVDGEILTDGLNGSGVNSFYLKLNGTDLGEDSSGNDNDWTANNLTASSLSFTSDDFADASHFNYVKNGTDGTNTLSSLLNSSGVPQATRNQWFSYGTNNAPDDHIEITFDPPIATTSEFSIYGGDYNSSAYDWTATVTYSDDTTDSVAGQSGSNDWWDRSSFNTGGKSVKKAKIASETSYVNILGFTKENSNNVILPIDPSTVDSLTDTPTDYGDDTGVGGEVRGNYCSMNPLNNGSNVTLSQGNLQTYSTSASWSQTERSVGTFGMRTGKWYWECHISAALYIYTGMISTDNLDAAYPGVDTTSIGLLTSNGDYYGGGVQASHNANVGSDVTLMYAFDADNKKMWFGVDGTWLTVGGTNVGNPSAGTYPSHTGFGSSNTTYFPASTTYGTHTCIYNFGQRAFANAAPSGFKCLCTQNLPDPTIEDPSKHFEALTYDGTGSTQSIGGLSFSPDLVWIKRRNNGTASHVINDSVRGAGEQLNSDDTTAEGTNTNNFSAFTADGFTVGTGSGTNSVSQHVAWNWNAGTANTSVSADDLTGTLYNQDQTWSTYGTFDNINGNGYLWSNVFNAVDEFDHTGCLYVGSGVMDEWDLTSSVAVTSSIKLLVANTPTKIVINEGLSDETTHTSTGSGAHYLEVAFSGNVQTISVGPPPSGTAIGVMGMWFDGKRLIDDTITVTTPSIASTYRANPSAGFSIVSYTGSGTSGDNVAHGLNDKPQLILTKNRDNNDYWAVYHTSLTSGYALQLDDAAAEFAGSQIYTSTAPTSTVFTVGSNDAVNASSEKYISYCWSEVAGYSKFSSYTGNDAADGIFEFTGFKPAFLLVKSIYSNSPNWFMVDSAQDPHNAVSSQLNPNVNSAVYDSPFVDFLSNGFKMRHSGNSGNASAHTYMYAAFAEHPFKHSRAR